MPRKKVLVIIDSQLAAQGFCSRYSRPDYVNENFILIGLHPNLRAYLARKGYICRDTQPYLSTDSRLRASSKSLEITEWIRDNFDFTDSLNVTYGYIENLVWYSRWSYNQILQLIEIVNTALNIHKPDEVIAFDYQKVSHGKGPYTNVNDMYVADICKYYCSQNNINVVYEKIENAINLRDSVKRTAKKFRTLVTTNIISARIHLKHIRKYSKVHPVLFTSDEYRLDTVATDIKSRAISVSKLQDWPETPTLHNLFKNASHSNLFLSGIQISAIEALSDDDAQSRFRLKNSLDRLLKNMQSQSQVFDYYGFGLIQPITNKIQSTISPLIFELHQRVATFQNILQTVQPCIVFSNGCRTDDIAMGELCRNLEIPAIMISHGSHVPTLHTESGNEWYEHARRLINAPFQYTAIQSPLGKRFRDECPSNSKSISTGPLTWATPINSNQSDRLKFIMLGDNIQDKVGVHAGTAKGPDGARFHIFESPDEYLQSIIDVSEAVNNIPNTRLIVVFRPIPEISADTLAYYLSHHHKTLISTGNPLTGILGFTDVLVSFSSTVIEEALQNYSPVILYGGQGRYKHIDCPEFSSDKDQIQECPMYHVLEKQYLVPAIEECIDRDIPLSRRSEMFSSYIFQEKDIIPIDQIISETIKSPIWTENNLKSV